MANNKSQRRAKAINKACRILVKQGMRFEMALKQVLSEGGARVQDLRQPGRATGHTYWCWRGI
jgi:hypothetical protein